jgi:hypothetical protein
MSTPEAIPALEVDFGTGLSSKIMRTSQDHREVRQQYRLLRRLIARLGLRAGCSVTLTFDKAAPARLELAK